MSLCEEAASAGFSSFKSRTGRTYDDSLNTDSNFFCLPLRSGLKDGHL
jgi:hypothetical protein